MEGVARSERFLKQSGSETYSQEILISKNLSRRGEENAPFVERCSLPWLDPYTIHPSTVPAVHDQNPAFFSFIILNIGVQSRNALERTKVYVDLGGRCGGRGGVGRDAPPTDSDIGGLEVVGDSRENEGIVCTDLVSCNCVLAELYIHRRGRRRRRSPGVQAVGCRR